MTMMKLLSLSFSNLHHPYRFFSLRTIFFVTLLLCNQGVNARYRKDGNPQSRSIQILNRSGVKIDYFWIHPTTGELAESQTEGGIINGADTSINSYIGHSFEVQELPRKMTGKCVKDECQKTTFTVNPNEDQVFTIGPDFEVTVEDHKTRAQQKAKDALQACNDETVNSSLSAEEQINRLAACMEKELKAAIDKTDEEIAFQRSVRKQMGQSWAEYACNDANMTTTIAIANETWRYTHPSIRSKNSYHKLNVFFYSDHEKIQRAQGFVAPEECKAVQEVAVANPSARISDHNFGLPLKSRQSNEHIDELMNKVEALATSLTGMHATMSKDPMMEIRIVQSDSAQEKGECVIEADGSTCTASSITPTSGSQVRRSPIESTVIDDPRVVVTVLIVCEAPEAGGQLYFPKTGTSLLPADMVGSVIVVLHEVDGEQEEDPYLNEYIMCPVQKGKMVTLMDYMAK